MKRRRYWYRVHFYDCPVCGRHETLRERVYGRKPKGYDKTHEFHTKYDWCDV